MNMVSSPTVDDHGLQPASAPARSRRSEAVEWILLIVFFLGYLFATSWTGVLYALAAVIMPLVGLWLVFSHGVRRYGWQRMITFFIVTQIVSNGFENLSILTGFPFGLYHYTGGPKIFLVPWFIGLAYFIIGYGAWTLAATLLNRADAHLDLRTRPGRVNVVLLPLLAGGLMTLWDLGMDSTSSTVDHNWVWAHGGAFFGVGAQNYFGWLFVTYIFFQIFTLILATPQSRGTTAGFDIARNNASAPALLLYFSAGCGAVSTYFSTHGTHRVVTDNAGVSWRVADISESMMLVSVLTVILFSAIGIGKIARGDESPSREPSELCRH